MPGRADSDESEPRSSCMVDAPPCASDMLRKVETRGERKGEATKNHHVKKGHNERRLEPKPNNTRRTMTKSHIDGPRCGHRAAVTNNTE